MHPETRAANALVVAESVTGLLVTALATGLIFVRFSRTRGRVVFSRQVAIGPIDGVPHLMVRVGNERSNQIFDAELRISLVRTAKTNEGVTIYRTLDLKLVRERAPSLARSFMLLHPIDPASPLARDTPQSLLADEAELSVAISGIDETSLQPVYGRYTYQADAIVFGARLDDVLDELPNGDLLLDLNRFHDLTPTEPTPTFPYPSR
jgi:inward rectifier potassium channel